MPNQPIHITPEVVYSQRRSLLKTLCLGGAALGSGSIASRANAGLFDKLWKDDKGQNSAIRHPLEFSKDTATNGLALTPENTVLSHNNFYEFGTAKTDPLLNSQQLKTEPWTITVDGEVDKPGKIDIWELVHSAKLIERIYRMRCVEAWSMVIPWIGVELNSILKKFEPTSKAKYVAFETLYDPDQMPGQRSRRVGGGIHYPYVEGLRIDEAMHPLTLLSLGLYGKTLAPQNGAPVRLVVPWKYGFKGIKSIVKIKLVEKIPPTTWNILAPREYGFYANVNPGVDHPRWSQGSERIIDDSNVFDVKRKPTLPFNGYADEVASMYSGMDLRKNY